MVLYWRSARWFNAAMDQFCPLEEEWSQPHYSFCCCCFYFKVEDEGEIVVKLSVQTENLAMQQKESQKKKVQLGKVSQTISSF